jgi:hypothetical protein
MVNEYGAMTFRQSFQVIETVYDETYLLEYDHFTRFSSDVKESRMVTFGFESFSQTRWLLFEVAGSHKIQIFSSLMREHAQLSTPFDLI